MTQQNRLSDPLSVLRAFDRLEVGPVRLDPDRLVAPYTVHSHDGADRFDFMYRFEEELFDASEPDDWNLAAMIAAQPALNYGLFSREIVFRGLYGRADQRLLTDMCENTAREIFVKKFLEPNPFLTQAARSLPAVKKDKYSQAKLIFPDEAGPAARHLSQRWRSNDSQVAVLSSGGKESLLTYAVLNEIGIRPHCLFINESGKHWFTALNAYRHFRSRIPGTARVWTNSDRLFSWMLRHLPFVREDFARIRSDEYPIRLWTVALFIFGALPLLRARGVSRLIVGDEFDTSDRRSYQGITHYNGLYDQSRYFDHALSRYFHRKGWGVSQFSILRPASELLVEKVLAERYPHLLSLQTSCHAAHMDGDRVRPCGKCEKCRRVVAMLLALGADPETSGYSPEQIRHCMQQWSERGAMQEGPALQQLALLLSGKGLLSAEAASKASARNRPEILKLRFDPERSPIDDIPVDLRAPLYRVLIDHSEGAVRRQGRTWMDFDLLHDPALSRPYRFDKPTGNSKPETNRSESYLLGELTWPEAKRRFRQIDIALLPVGAVEQHGPHLPLDTDSYDAECLCKAVAEQCGEPKPIVLPLIPYGVSYHHEDFSGTISIGPETLSRLVYEIGLSVARHGVRKLVIVNGHGGNVPTLQFAAQLINRDAHIFTCVDSGETSDPDVEALAETPSDVHAGEIETSTSLANREHLVQMDKARKFVPRFSSHYLDFSSKRSVEWYGRTEKISPSGVLGDPTKATKAKGEKMWSLMIQHLVALVEDLKGMTLDEIHQKSRY